MEIYNKCHVNHRFSVLTVNKKRDAMDAISVNSTVAIDSEPEVIELDSTCDISEITCLTDDSIHNSKNKECLVPNVIRSQPVFRVMFRDESVSR